MENDSISIVSVSEDNEVDNSDVRITFPVTYNGTGAGAAKLTPS